MPTRPDTTNVVSMFFTFEQAAELAGLELGRFSNWRRSGLYRPEHNEHQICTFRDVVALRTLRILADEYKIPIRGKRGLRTFGAYLQRVRAHPWSELRFHVAGRELFFRDPDSDRLISNYPQGQVADGDLFPIERVEMDVRQLAKPLTTRSREDVGHVGQRKGIQANQPTIRGTRIRTASVFELYEGGFSVEQILEQYPSLKRADVEAAIKFETSERHRRRRASA